MLYVCCAQWRNKGREPRLPHCSRHKANHTGSVRIIASRPDDKREEERAAAQEDSNPTTHTLLRATHKFSLARSALQCAVYGLHVQYYGCSVYVAKALFSHEERPAISHTTHSVQIQGKSSSMGARSKGNTHQARRPRDETSSFPSDPFYSVSLLLHNPFSFEGFSLSLLLFFLLFSVELYFSATSLLILFRALRFHIPERAVRCSKTSLCASCEKKRAADDAKYQNAGLIM